MLARLPQRVIRRLLPRAPAPADAASPASAAIAHADAARDRGDFAAAAPLYLEALRHDPSLGGIQVQAGHMFKESGDLASAERCYGEALKLMPDDPDLALQLGHFYKVSGRRPEAEAAYRRAAELSPDWAAPRAELATLARIGGAAPTADARRALDLPPEHLGPDGTPDDALTARLYGRLAPELLPRPLEALQFHSGEAIHLRQFGRPQRTFWGMAPVLRGVEAIRGVVYSTSPLAEVDARVDGLSIHRGPLKGPFELEYEPEATRRNIHRYAFNIWHDFSGYALGRFALEIVAWTTDGRRQTSTRHFVVEAPLLEADHPASDSVITLPPDASDSIEAQVFARPSMVREAWRPNQLGEIKSILVVRTDQLGDLVVSIPAIRRLREIFPAAKLVAMLGPANTALGKTLGLFDDIITVSHPESWPQRTRTLALSEQQAIADRCATYGFDIAIDLAHSTMARQILALTGARLLYGFEDRSWPRPTLTYQDGFLDPKNGQEAATLSKRYLNMVERLRAMVEPTGGTLQRDDLSRARLQPYGLLETDRYAVLHTGARIVWSRWRHYAALAQRLIAECDLKVALFTDDADLKDRLPLGLAGSDRLILLDRQLPFDDFDAFLSFAEVYVGNDSGPKHLASLRGVPVVSIHSSRINWSEWGQEHTGLIISRKMPCAGCHIYHDPEECGKDYACMDIKLDEVYAAVRRYV